MKSKAPNLIEIKQWTKWFAIEHNNRAWSLAEQAERTDAEAEEMIHAAHAAALHWSRVGLPVNQLRANQLLAWVHALIGDAEKAAGFAGRARVAIDAQIEGLSDWDRAFQSLIDLFCLQDEGKGASKTAQRALQARQRITDPESLKVFDNFAKQAGVDL